MASASAQPLASAPNAPAVNPLIEIDYVAPKNPYFLGVAERLKARKVLEELREFLAPLKLPRTLGIKTRECGATNAYYSSAEVAVNICYEYVDWIERLTPKENSRLSKASDVLVGAFVEVVMHELGHAVINLFEVPVFGKEEDAADQIAGYVMMQFGAATAHRLLTGTAYVYRAQAKVDPPNFSDIHSTDKQRYSNYLCLAYGGRPDIFQDLVGFLPKERVEDCQREYEQVASAFAQTIGPSIDRDLLAANQNVEWLRPDDGTLP